MEVVTFSDNIAVSTSIKTDPNTFFRFISFVCRELLTHGFLTRGGVTAGELRHVENMIFGPALIEAVSLEKEAVYPRILCSRRLIEHIKDKEHAQLPTIIINDQLGRPILNILCSVKQNNPASWMDIKKVIFQTISQMETNNAPDKYLEKWRFMRDVLPIMICAAPAY